MIFADNWFDAVTAFETVYFRPDLPQCFRKFLPGAEARQDITHLQPKQQRYGQGQKWTEIIGSMTIYKDAELRRRIWSRRAFTRCQIHKKKSWLCITAWK